MKNTSVAAVPCFHRTHRKLLASWLEAQGNEEPMPGEIIRFWSFAEQNPRLRRQSVAMHVEGMKHLAGHIGNTLRQQESLELDLALLIRAFSVHDQGEILLGRDIRWSKKQAHHDVEEYVAFMEWLVKQETSRNLKKQLEEAFLLQFAINDFLSFPKPAQAIMKRLMGSNLLEAQLFATIETFEYVLYAMECFLYHEDYTILTSVLRNQIPRLNDFSQKIPAFGGHFWTPEIAEECRRFTESHAEDVPEE